MNTFLEHIILFEKWDLAYKAWENQTDENTIELYIDKFKVLKQKRRIPKGKDDIIVWTKGEFAPFKKFIDELSTQDEKMMKARLEEQKKLSQGVEKIFENGKALVLWIKSYEASCKYGAGTKWCISGNTDEHWDSYISQGIKFYFIIFKGKPQSDPFYKLAIAVYSHNEDESPLYEVYNAIDSNISTQDTQSILTENNIPISLFTNPTDWNKWLNQYKHTINSDGSVTVQESVQFHDAIKKLPFTFDTIYGDFKASGLQTLKGSPKEVTGTYEISYCKLDNCIDAPKRVKNISIHNSAITSFKGLPDKVFNIFLESISCESLEGLPKIVEANCKLRWIPITNLKGCPQQIGGSLSIAKCSKLTSLEGLPAKYIEQLWIGECNHLRHFNIPTEFISSLYIVSQSIERVEVLPKRVVSLALEHATIENEALEDLKKHRMSITGDLTIKSCSWYTPTRPGQTRAELMKELQETYPSTSIDELKKVSLNFHNHFNITRFILNYIFDIKHLDNNQITIL